MTVEVCVCVRKWKRNASPAQTGAKVKWGNKNLHHSLGTDKDCADGGFLVVVVEEAKTKATVQDILRSFNEVHPCTREWFAGREIT